MSSGKGMAVMSRGRRAPDRLSTFSDGVFAVLITVLVLELRPPELPTFKALLSLWPTWLSCAVSYLFIAIFWANHTTISCTMPPRPLLASCGLTSPTRFPFPCFRSPTAWMAVSELAPQPVAFYAVVFLLVNVTYIALIHELIDRAPTDHVPPREHRIMRFRSIATLCVFAAAAVVALKYPLVGLGMCICCLIVYLKPEAPGAEK
jgi:uncharacterized membrane protein